MIEITEVTGHNNPRARKLGTVDVRLQLQIDGEDDVTISAVSVIDADMTRSSLREAAEKLYTYDNEFFDDDGDRIEEPDIVPLVNIKSILNKIVSRRPATD